MKCSFPGCTKWKAVNVPTPFCRAHFQPSTESTDNPISPVVLNDVGVSSFRTFTLGKVVEHKRMNKYEEVEQAASSSEMCMLQQKDLDSTHMPYLCYILLVEECPVRALNLYLNPSIGPEGAKAIADVLRRNTKLTLLNLKCCGLKHEGAVEIVRALETNHTLQVLSLEANRTEHGMCQVIFSMLRRSPASLADSFPASALRSLSLAFNSLGPEGGAVLAELLRNGCTLEELDVEGNNIGGECVTMIQALAENSHLHALNLSCNAISSTQGSSLVSALLARGRGTKSISMLSTLLLVGNDLDLKSMRILLTLVSLDGVLRNVDVRHNSDEEGAFQILVEFALLVYLPMVLAEIISSYMFSKEDALKQKR